MSAFVALNIEPEEGPEEELDDTKEIQIEEALKLYQTALKLHSQGPRFYDQAAEAYKALFKSEIFQYSESVSEYKNFENLLSEDGTEDFVAARAPAIEDNESNSSALLQTIYLSYKNYGQFILDSLKNSIDTLPRADVVNSSSSALTHFADALERDDSDLQLWRKGGRVGDALKSYRIARFCLESVLEGDSDGLDGPQRLGLEQACTISDLKQILGSLSDKLSLSSFPHRRPRLALSRLLKKEIDPFPHLPSTLRNQEDFSVGSDVIIGSPGHGTIKTAAQTWESLGQGVLEYLKAYLTEGETSHPSTIEISLPETSNRRESTAIELPIIQQQKPSDKSRHQTPDKVENTETNHSPEATTLSESIRATSAGQEADANEANAQEDNPRVESEQADTHEKTKQPNKAEGESEAKSNGAQPRKRSSTSIANDEPADGGRTKSKRIRARESIAEAQIQQEDVPFDQTRYFEDRLEVYGHADQWMFSTAGAMLSKLGVEDLGTIEQLRQAVAPSDNSTSPSGNSLVPCHEIPLFQDLRDAIESWDDSKAHAALHSNIFTSAGEGLRGAERTGVSVFLEHSKQGNQTCDKEMGSIDNRGVIEFSEHINSSGLSVQEAAFRWLQQHLEARVPIESEGVDDFDDTRNDPKSTYMSQKWPEKMKSTVIGILLESDEFIYRKLRQYADGLEHRVLKHKLDKPYTITSTDKAVIEMAQSIYELHLDILGSTNAQGDGAPGFAKSLQQYRLSRWRSLAVGYVNIYLNLCEKGDKQTSVMLRHLYSFVFHCSLADDCDQDYVLLCLRDVRQVIISLGSPVIWLVNNDTIPEISVRAIDQEIARLGAMGFFMKIFGSEDVDPVYLIESIESILDPSAVTYNTNEEKNSPGKLDHTVHTQSLVSFLDRGDATLRLFLWDRLRKAYDSIDHPTKVVSCYLRSIETVVDEFARPAYSAASNENRQSDLLKWLKLINDLLDKALRKVVEKPDISFECFDIEHLQRSMSAIARLSRILHAFALYEDSIRVGQVTPPEIRPASLSKSLELFKDRLRGMIVRSWTLQYALLRESIEQSRELFDTPLDDRIHYLRSVHNSLGLRSYCKCSEKIFLKLMKDELLNLNTEDNYEFDVAQVLFDLYGLKFTPNLDVSDHSCPIEGLDRESAPLIVDFAITQANRMDIKDFMKSELKSTIDTLQRVIGWIGKGTPSLTFNKRILSTFLKSPVNPLQLFRSIKGVSELSMVPVQARSTAISEKGWYFLLGFAAITKFRTQKRIGPTSTDDLDLAASFLRHDLEHGMDRWETWYRLAQVYDMKLEEDIAWSATKLNNNRDELAVLERRAIHSYSMAVAAAIRATDLSSEAKRTVSELYAQFGFRIYASSRAPLSMGAFDTTPFIKHFSGGDDQRMYEGKPFQGMQPMSAWNFAGYLFRKALVDRPMHWMSRYMLSKCLWKMYCHGDSTNPTSKKIGMSEVLDSLTDTINVLPKKRDNRSDPILEPHFKLVSVIHKLVKRGDITPEDASEKLISTPWAKNLSIAKGFESWKDFVLQVLKALRGADKSNWHHRIVVRAAHVIYDDQEDEAAALAAKNDLTQHIFTKTMNVQVWRPEYERAGRHFVYTTRYVYFFVHLLHQLGDRASLDMLVRRVRRKLSDYLDYTKLWEDICSTYISLLRRVGNIPEGHEETVFKGVTHDEFTTHSSRLEEWCLKNTAENPTIDLLRDAVELKKLNGTLMKSSMFDDVVFDIYARLYEEKTPEFVEQVAEEENRERMKVNHLLMIGEKTEGTETPPIPTPSAPTPVPGPKPRVKGVTRRELQRKADTIATKAPRPTPKPTRPTEDDSRPPPPEQSSDKPEEKTDTKDDEPPVIQPSAPASVQDSADDESELSEFDEDKVAEAVKPSNTALFPNLLVKRITSPKPGSEISTNVSVDGGDNESVPTVSMQDTKPEQEEPQIEAQTEPQPEPEPQTEGDTEMQD